jgi:chromate transporter
MPDFVQQETIQHPPLKTALKYWFKLGWISFGGPAGQIALLHDELVVRRHWISEKRFLHALNYCMILPGPEAQQLATYTGWLLHGRLGGILAGALFILPSLFILMALAWIYMVWGHTIVLAGIFAGIKPAVTVIVLQAAWRLGTRVLKQAVLWGVAASAFISAFLNVPFPLVIALAALTGWLLDRAGYLSVSAASHGVTQHAEQRRSSLIDDHTVVPEHALLKARSIIGVLLIGVALWALPIGAMVAIFGVQDPLVQMSWFFTKAALLTFGGAYAVLPYVYQGAVNHYLWLTPTQMIDGLALGETTPGPLIMIVTFVAFVAGYQNLMLGEGHALAAGVLAACFTTWFTFLPSFVFILAGAPLVERTRQMPRLTAPLTGISAAVVGFIVNLALFFAIHVLWEKKTLPTSFEMLWSGLNGSALVIMLIASALLFWRKWNVMPVLLVCAVMGLGVSLI